MELTKQVTPRVVTFLLVLSRFSGASFQLRQPHPRRTESCKLAFDLSSAFEWLSEDRYQDPGYSHIQWIDLQQRSESSTLPSGAMTVPLYPLGACYLQSGINQTLNNIEPQNLKMAQDLLQQESPLFCVTLRAMDTGRVAHIGTLMRILDADEQYVDDRLVRIRLTCRPEQLVQISEILNGEAFSLQNRLQKSSEYLQARVHPLEEIMDSRDGWDDEIVQTMIDNFNMIKTIYQLQIGGADFPPSTLFQLGNAMSTWDTSTFSSSSTFWQAAQEWQSICYTIRQGRQAMLSIHRNELMVEAAAALGPLKLPIHLEDLPPTVQRQVQMMEVEFQKQFLELGMDPCLDFQALISLPDTRKRVLCLSHWIARERRRLEVVATQMSKARR